MCLWHKKSAFSASHMYIGAQRAFNLPMQENENILVSSCGDGSIKVWDVAAPQQANPLRHFQEHTREVNIYDMAALFHRFFQAEMDLKETPHATH